MMDAAALRDIFVTVVQTRQCHLCAASPVDEAVYHDAAAAVLCVNCSLAHGAPPRAHVVWTPAACLALETNAPDVEGP